MHTPSFTPSVRHPAPQQYESPLHSLSLAQAPLVGAQMLEMQMLALSHLPLASHGVMGSCELPPVPELASPLFRIPAPPPLPWKKPPDPRAPPEPVSPPPPP